MGTSLAHTGGHWQARAERIRVPKFYGSTDARFKKLMAWKEENIPEGYCLTLDEIGTAVGLTRERVRQIEARALRKLRHPTRINQIK